MEYGLLCLAAVEAFAFGIWAYFYYKCRPKKTRQLRVFVCAPGQNCNGCKRWLGCEFRKD
jgi:hypothetical protein